MNAASVGLTPLQVIAVRAAISMHRTQLVLSMHKARKRPEDAEVLRGAIEVYDSVDRLLKCSRNGNPCRPVLTEKPDALGAGNGRPPGDPANDS